MRQMLLQPLLNVHIAIGAGPVESDSCQSCQCPDCGQNLTEHAKHETNRKLNCGFMGIVVLRKKNKHKCFIFFYIVLLRFKFQYNFLSPLKATSPTPKAHSRRPRCWVLPGPRLRREWHVAVPAGRAERAHLGSQKLQNKVWKYVT